MDTSQSISAMTPASAAKNIFSWNPISALMRSAFDMEDSIPAAIPSLQYSSIGSGGTKLEGGRPLSFYSTNNSSSSAFWLCRRFSASSHTTLCGPSITAAATSSPRCAGRQCMNKASGCAAAMTASVTW